MKKLYLLSALMFLGAMKGQTEVRVLPEMGSTLVNINNSGQALYQRGYYDYATNTSTPVEAEATATNRINDTGIVTGSTGFVTVDGFNADEAAYRKDGTWKKIGFFPGDIPKNSWFGDAIGVSTNGKYITGQISTAAIRTYPFVYNTETETLTKLNDDDLLWLYGRGEGINNDGYVAGFVDREDLSPQGTLWAPAYWDPAGNIHYIDIDNPEDGEAADINDAGLIVGYKGTKAFTYDVHTGVYKAFKSQPGMENPVFTEVSDDGLVVGYAGQLGNRDVIVYHKNLMAPIYLSDYLTSKGIDIPTVDGKLGTGMSVSANSKFICGFDNQGPPAPFASGWIVKLEEFPTGPGCLDAPNGVNPSAVFTPACTGAEEVITTTAKTGQYSLVQLTAGKEYVFSSSITTDFITIAKDDGSMVLKYGNGPITFLATQDQIVRFSLNLNENCASSNETRSKSVICRVPVGCQWTVKVWDDMIGDEVSWYLKNTNTGEILLSGENYGDGYTDIQTVFADGPLRFYIEAYGDWNDNTPAFTVSNGTTVVAEGVLGGGDSKTYDNLNCASMATAETAVSKLRYYPNPVKDVLTINGQKEIKNVSVYAIDGKMILHNVKISNKEGKINLSSVSVGSYIVTVTMADGTTETFKILKQ